MYNKYNSLIRECVCNREEQEATLLFLLHPNETLVSLVISLPASRETFTLESNQIQTVCSVAVRKDQSDLPQFIVLILQDMRVLR